jgi:hypothetical protein
MTFRLVEFIVAPDENSPVVINDIRGYKVINQIFEHKSREKLLRMARKNGVKIRGNSLVEITEYQDSLWN